MEYFARESMVYFPVMYLVIGLDTERKELQNFSATSFMTYFVSGKF